MRSKLFAKVLAVLMCLAVLCVGLIACKKIDPPPIDEPTPTELFREAVGNIEKSFVVKDANRFFVDFKANAKLDETTNEKNNIFDYEIIVKANINLYGSEADTSMRIELNEIKNVDGVNKPTTIFGLLYESEVDDNDTLKGNYFYLTISGETLKVNAFSMKKLVNLAGGNTQSVADMNIGELIMGVVELFIQEGRVEGNNYIFDFDLQETWSMVSGLLSGFLEDPSELNSIIGADISEYLDIVNLAIEKLFGNLEYTPDGQDGLTNVKDIAGLFKYVDQNMPAIMLSLTFKFDDNKNFIGATALADYEAGKDSGEFTPTHKFSLDISKIYIGDKNAVQVDEGYHLSKEERVAMTDVINILKFSLNGRIVLGSQAHTLSINADINPFVLIEGLTNDKLAKLGYFNLTIKNEASGKNMLTLHCNSSEKQIVVSYETPGTSGYPISDTVAIAGVYGFDDIMNFSAWMNSNSGGKAATQTVSDGESGANTIVTVITSLLSRIDFSEFSTTGVKISDCRAMIYEIAEVLGIPSTGMMDLANLIHGHLFDWTDDLAIAVEKNGVKFNECNKVDTKDLELQGYAEPDSGKTLNPTRSVSSDDIQKSYEYGEEFNVNLYGKTGGTVMPNSFKIKGYNRDGASNQIYDAVLYGYSGFDPYKPGKQKVKVFYGINSKVSKVLANGMIYGQLGDFIPSTTPLFGLHTMEIEVTVYDEVDNNAVMVLVNGTQKFGAGENIAEKLNAVLRYRDNGGQIREIPVTDDMISCVKPCIVDNAIQYMGKYTLDITYKNLIKAQVDVTIGELQITAPSSVDSGTNFNDLVDINLRYYGEDGNIIVETPQLNIIKIWYTYLSKDYEIGFDEIFTEDMTFKNNFMLISEGILKKNIFFELEYEMFGETKTRVLKIDNMSNGSGYTIASNFKVYKSNSKVSGVDYSATKITVGSKTYVTVWDIENQKWIASTNTETPEILNKDIVVEIYKLAEWNETKRNFDEFVEPQLVTINNNNLVLGAGIYKQITTIPSDNAYFCNDKILIYPFIYRKVDTGTSLSSIFGTSIDTTEFTSIPEKAKGATELSLAWNKTEKKWIFKFNKGTDIEPLEDDFKYSIDITMSKDKGATWIPAEYSDERYGYFMKDDDGKYLPHKIVIKYSLMGGEEVTINYEFNIPEPEPSPEA